MGFSLCKRAQRRENWKTAPYVPTVGDGLVQGVGDFYSVIVSHTYDQPLSTIVVISNTCSGVFLGLLV